MERYDPSAAPDREDWLELDEQERVVLVENYHRGARIDLPNPSLHATIHVVVENQLALEDQPVVRVLTRLMKEGLTRHHAVHAIGSVVAEHIYNLLHSKGAADPAHAAYYAAIEELTAAKWRGG